MKINRNKGNLQSQLAKMLQAGMENVETEQKAGNQSINKGVLHANNQSGNDANDATTPAQQEHEAENKINKQESQQTEAEAPQKEDNPDVKPTPRRTTRTSASQSSRAASTRSRRQARQPEREAPRLNAAQRHEVPDHNAKYAGEPIKSVGCRMPQSLYARMLQYKALNDSQLNRITLNDIIIEAVEKFMDENG